jgi:hypothetical protein
MGHICVVIRATHDMRPAGRMFDMPDIEYVFFVQNVFYTWKYVGQSISFRIEFVALVRSVVTKPAARGIIPKVS